MTPESTFQIPSKLESCSAATRGRKTRRWLRGTSQLPSPNRVASATAMGTDMSRYRFVAGPGKIPSKRGYTWRRLWLDTLSRRGSYNYIDQDLQFRSFRRSLL